MPFAEINLVSPMLAITLIVYIGLSSAGGVLTWKDSSIRVLHLFAGLMTDT